MNYEINQIKNNIIKTYENANIVKDNQKRYDLYCFLDAIFYLFEKCEYISDYDLAFSYLIDSCCELILKQKNINNIYMPIHLSDAIREVKTAFFRYYDNKYSFIECSYLTTICSLAFEGYKQYKKSLPLGA